MGTVTELCPHCRWPAVLQLLGQLVDRLASLEAVIEDVPTHLLADADAAAPMAADAHDPGATMEREVADCKLGSMVTCPSWHDLCALSHGVRGGCLHVGMVAS